MDINKAISDQVQLSEEAERRYTEVSTALQTQLKKIMEYRIQFAQFEIRLLDQLNKQELELEKIEKSFKNG